MWAGAEMRATTVAVPLVSIGAITPGQRYVYRCPVRGFAITESDRGFSALAGRRPCPARQARRPR